MSDLSISPEPGCCGQLNWRLDLPVDSDFDRLRQQLESVGYRAACRHSFLVVLRHREGHEIAIVPRTGRVQLRVDRLTAEGERATVAAGIAGDLATAMDASSVAQPSRGQGNPMLNPTPTSTGSKMLKLLAVCLLCLLIAGGIGFLIHQFM